MAKDKDLVRINGRIQLGDSSGKYSRFGVFEKIDGEDYICFERVSHGRNLVPVYLPRSKENEHVVNRLAGPGDVVSMEGKYVQDHFVAYRTDVLSKSHTGRRSKLSGDSSGIRELIRQRSEILRTLRSSFEDSGFLEVSTPVLLSHYEGGDASPFVTKGKGGKDYYLKETSELILRKLISMDFGKVYEVGKSFRNIGITSNTLNEFNVVESAIPYACLEDGVDFSEYLLKDMICAVDENSPLLTDWGRVSFENVFEEVTGSQYAPSGDYKDDRKDLTTVINNIDGPAYLVGLPMGTSPIIKCGETTLREAVLVLNNSVYCDVCEFDTDMGSVRERLLEQKKRTGRINESFLDFMKEGMVPGVGVAFGIERWMKYFTGENIGEIKNIGGLI